MHVTDPATVNTGATNSVSHHASQSTTCLNKQPKPLLVSGLDPGLFMFLDIASALWITVYYCV